MLGPEGPGRTSVGGGPRVKGDCVIRSADLRPLTRSEGEGELADTVRAMRRIRFVLAVVVAAVAVALVVNYFVARVVDGGRQELPITVVVALLAVVIALRASRHDR